MKNIPIPSKDEYLMQLIYSTKKFIRNLRWRAFFFLHPEKRGREKEYFGFSSIRALEESIPELKLFEQRLMALIRDVEFRRFSNDFQDTLRWEILMKAPPWNPTSNICRLCILEKHHILFHPEDSSLNQRSEFFTVCRHKEKHLLMKS